MTNKLLRYLYSLRSLQRMNIALARGGALGNARQVDLCRPDTWEFSGFSQNGEDGIIEILLRHAPRSNRYFIEIGASDGLENNTAWLSLARRFGGLWIEGDPVVSSRCKEFFSALNYGVESINMFVTTETVTELLTLSRYANPDVFSLDIDGNDYYIAESMLRGGMKPKICVVEYNSAFGPDASVTVPYIEDFRIQQKYGANLYYGCSVRGWRTLFSRFGYRFVTVDSNGLNAFFVDPAEFDAGFLADIRGLDFAENVAQARQYRRGWQGQAALINDRPFVQLT